MIKAKYIVAFLFILLCAGKGYSQIISTLKCTPVLYMAEKNLKEKYMIEFNANIDSVSAIQLSIGNNSGVSDIESSTYTLVKKDQSYLLQYSNGSQLVTPPSVRFYFESSGGNYRDKFLTVVLIMKNGQQSTPVSVVIQ